MKVISIKGPLIDNGEKWIYDLFGIDATCPNDLTNELPEDGDDIRVIINSGGGYVNVGSEMYTILKSYEGGVTVDVIEAYSAASVVAMAGNPTRITPIGKLMIHNASCSAEGDYHAMDKSSEILQKVNESISNAYRLKTGMSREKLLALMDQETWMTAEDAHKYGFADEILFQEEAVPKLVANFKDMLPGRVVSKMQNLKPGFGAQPAQPSVDLNALAEKVADKIYSKLTEQNQKPQNSSPFTKYLF